MSTIIRLAVCCLALVLMVEAYPRGQRWTKRMTRTCEMNAEKGFHCYLCGKLTDSPQIYQGCCEGDPSTTDFCSGILA